MDESDREYIRRVFADLTGVLEDASAEAVEGQSWRITPETSASIIHDIEKALEEADRLLGKI